MPRQHRGLLASVLVLAVASIVVACSSGSSPATSGGLGEPPDGAAITGIGFGCCVLQDEPSVCTLRLGRAKRSADDDCIDGYDGVNPDPKAPGWTQVNDKDGCPVWTPPPNAPTVCCGCPSHDSGAAASEAGDADASDQ